MLLAVRTVALGGWWGMEERIQGLWASNNILSVDQGAGGIAVSVCGNSASCIVTLYPKVKYCIIQNVKIFVHICTSHINAHNMYLCPIILMWLF